MVVCGRLLTRETRRFAKEYELISLIGQGSFGEVWVCRDRKTSAFYAAKLIDKTSLRTFGERSDIQREIAVLETFRGKHDGVVQLHEVLEGDTVVQLVMELCSGGDLFELLKDKGALPEEAAKAMFRQLASVLAFCHAHGVVHRDIKPENILLTIPGHALYDVQAASDHMPPVMLRLADFGLATVLGPSGQTSGYTGSKYYTAPEMLKGWMYGRGADVWSMGVVLCSMLTGRLPFAGQNKQDIEGLRRAIVRGKVNFSQPTWTRVSDKAKDLVRRMLTVDPTERITADEILSHPWLAGGKASAACKESLTSQKPTSHSLPSSPVDTHRNMDRQQPHASAALESLSHFLLQSHPGGVVGTTAGASSAPPVTGPPVRERECMDAVSHKGSHADLAVQNAGDGSSVHPMCCVSPLALSDFASAGVWCFPMTMMGWGAEPEHDHQSSKPAVEEHPPQAFLAPVTSSSSKDPGFQLKLGEWHKCLAPRQVYHVR